MYGPSMVMNMDKAKIGRMCCDCSGLISSYTGILRNTAHYYDLATERATISQLKANWQKYVGWGIWMRGHIGIVSDTEGYYYAMDGSARNAAHLPIEMWDWKCVIKISDIKYGSGGFSIIQNPTLNPVKSDINVYYRVYTDSKWYGEVKNCSNTASSGGFAGAEGKPVHCIMARLSRGTIKSRVHITGGGWSDWVQRGLIFLVVSCPCALVISVPLSFFGGIGGASRLGILVKGSNYLETLAGTETVVFDKTGTLTDGSFNVVAIHPQAGIDPDRLLSIAAHAEAYSNHPIALSVKQAYSGPIDQQRIDDVQEQSGHGVRAKIDEHVVLVGNDKLMSECGVGCHECELTGTILHVSLDGEYIGHIVIADVVKPDAAEAVAALRAAGVKKTVMLTGDRADVAAAVAKELGIDEFRAQLLPQDKVAEVEKLLEETHEKGSGKGKLAFVGDGINDAPVLTRADIGIAMGAMGSDAAIEAADVVLMDDKPSNIARAIGIARKTMGIVWQNIVFALGIKFLVLVLAAVGIANMWLAVFADVGVAVIAILNAMRAMSVKK